MSGGGLGRGLAAIIPAASGRDRLLEVPVEAVTPNPRQPRREFEETGIEELASSIRRVGVLQPILVRARSEGYELIAGERRLRAARAAGLVSIPAIVRGAKDEESLQEALIENIHRADLSPLELAEAYRSLVDDLGVSQEEAAVRLGVSRSQMANTMRLLGLPEDVRRLLSAGRIQAGHARALLGLPDPEAQSALALRAAAEGLSVRQVEELVRRYGAAGRAPREGAPDGRVAVLGEIEEMLSERLGSRVRVSMGKRRGRLVVEFATWEDLDRIVVAIAGAPEGEEE